MQLLVLKLELLLCGFGKSQITEVRKKKYLLRALISTVSELEPSGMYMVRSRYYILEEVVAISRK